MVGGGAGVSELFSTMNLKIKYFFLFGGGGERGGGKGEGGRG